MVTFSNIKDHCIDPPNNWTLLGAPEEFINFSNEFKDQILFLDQEACDFLYKHFNASNFHTGPMWDPFNGGNFERVTQIKVGVESEADIKKWLYQCGIPFAKWVYVLPNFSDHPIMMTWKMVIKHCDSLFFANDVVVFDETGKWCLTFWHEDILFFGTNLK